MSTKLEAKPEYLSGLLAKLPVYFFGIGALSLVGAVSLGLKDKHHFYFSYLTSYMYFLTISLGGLFIITILHLTRAGWGIVLRRIAEHIMKNIGLMALLFIPILFGLYELYEWTNADEVLHSAVLQAKSPYLNVSFFLIRISAYFLFWFFMSRAYFKRSIEQDKTADAQLTAKQQRHSTWGVLVFALTITFAAFDLIMSLSPHWYSTMFGVYVFAGSVLSGLCLTSFIALVLRRAGFLRSVISVEHYHDIGKLIYGFVVFWAYTGFSQYFLIWYANIPEETVWYLARTQGNWEKISIFLAIGHFAVPFLLFMSRHIKRNLVLHFLMVSWLLIMHFVDIAWMILPTALPNGFHLYLVDIACFVGIASLFAGVLLHRLKQHAIYPHNDPRIQDSLAFENY